MHQMIILYSLSIRVKMVHENEVILILYSKVSGLIQPNNIHLYLGKTVMTCT